jgi:hypothetical protein
MDILGVLQALKGKVLDAAHFELLKHAYELQDENLRQLKNNNDALRENNELSKDKATRLEAENKALRRKVEVLETDRPKGPAPEVELSLAANTILEKFKELDKTDLYDEDLFKWLDMTRIEIETGLDELQNLGLIDIAGYGQQGNNYYLTEKGKRFILGKI